jgi:hypothetical protein
MKLPESAADIIPKNPILPDGRKIDMPDKNEAYIINPYVGKKMLTKNEALNAINLLSGMVLIDVSNRRREKNDNED